MKRLGILLLLLGVAGCSMQSQMTYKQELTTWTGVPEQRLVSSEWGKPGRIFTQPNGTEIYCYYRPDYREFRNVAPTYFPYGSPVVVTPYVFDRFSPQNSWCETCFFMNKQKRVQKYLYRGPGCLNALAEA